jgi:hypothetical protein
MNKEAINLSGRRCKRGAGRDRDAGPLDPRRDKKLCPRRRSLITRIKAPGDLLFRWRSDKKPGRPARQLPNRSASLFSGEGRRGWSRGVWGTEPAARDFLRGPTLTRNYRWNASSFIATGFHGRYDVPRRLSRYRRSSVLRSKGGKH